MSEKEMDLLANRLNFDAVIYKGCSMNDMLMISGGSLSMGCLLFGTLGQLVLGNFLYGMALGFLVGGGLIFLICTIFEKLRRGQEKGYIQQLIAAKCHRLGLTPNSHVVRRSGVWMIGRRIS